MRTYNKHGWCWALGRKASLELSVTACLICHISIFSILTPLKCHSPFISSKRPVPMLMAQGCISSERFPVHWPADRRQIGVLCSSLVNQIDLSEQLYLDLSQVFSTVLWGKFCACVAEKQALLQEGWQMCGKKPRLIPAGGIIKS